MRTPKHIKNWCEWEIENIMDLYGNTSLEAVENILDRLGEGEYSDVLGAQETFAAVVYLTKQKLLLKDKGYESEG